MKERIKINDQLTVGAQPTAEQLQQWAQEGFKSVVNLRMAGEEDQPLSPEKEGAQVRGLGMEYRHIPVSVTSMKPELVDQFRQELTHLSHPVFVHCRTGKRSGAFAMMHQAIATGMSGEETMHNAEQMGFACDVPELMAFGKNYSDQHQK